MRQVIVGAIALVGMLSVATALAAQATPPPPPPATQQAGAPPVTVAKPEADAADMTTATYGDWLLRCRQMPGQTPPRSCEVMQSLVVQGQTAPLAQLAFGRTAPKEPLYFTAVVPLNVSFPSTVRIALDEKDDKPVALAWTRCLPAGCFASVALTDAALATWRARNEGGRLIFRNGAGQDTIVPMSFRGLARALDALAAAEK